MFGKGVRPKEISDRRRCTTVLYEDRPKMRRLVQAALEAAGRQGANTKQAVVMGYCFGGTVTLEAARSGAPFAGFATFHGGLSTPPGQDYSRTKGKVLILHGAADSHITMDDFAVLGKELEAHKIEHEMIAYGGAPHGFTVFGSDSYREDADHKSWSRFLEFLATTIR